MKHGYLLIFLFAQFSLASGQNNDSIEDYILKYRHLEFLSVDSQIIPITLFIQPDGNFFLRNGHVERTVKDEEIIHYSFDKKGKQIAQRPEKYESNNDCSLAVAINNFFPKVYNKPESEYLMSYVEEYSILLQLFNETVLFNSSDSNVIRIVSPCYDYIGNLKKQGYQSYNLIRVQLDNINNLIFKSGHFDEKSNFVVDFEYTYLLNRKEIRQIQKQICGIHFIDDNIYFMKNSSMQKLFEFKYKGKYYMFLRADLYEDKVTDLSSYIGLFNRLFSIIRDNFHGGIDKCK